MGEGPESPELCLLQGLKEGNVNEKVRKNVWDGGSQWVWGKKQLLINCGPRVWSGGFYLLNKDYLFFPSKILLKFVWGTVSVSPSPPPPSPSSSFSSSSLYSPSSEFYPHSTPTAGSGWPLLQIILCVPAYWVLVSCELAHTCQNLLPWLCADGLCFSFLMAVVVFASPWRQAVSNGHLSRLHGLFCLFSLLLQSLGCLQLLLEFLGVKLNNPKRHPWSPCIPSDHFFISARSPGLHIVDSHCSGPPMVQQRLKTQGHLYPGHDQSAMVSYICKKFKVIAIYISITTPEFCLGENMT